MKKIFVSILLVSIVGIAGADVISPLSTADITYDAAGLTGLTYGGTTYTTAQLGLGTTTRYYAQKKWDETNQVWINEDSGLRKAWTPDLADGTVPDDLFLVAGASSVKTTDVGSRADNFLWYTAGASPVYDMASLDRLPYMETMFAAPSNVFFYFERGTTYDVGTIYGITGGVLGDPIDLTADAYTGGEISHGGGKIKAYVVTFDQAVDGIRFEVQGADAFTITTIPEPATMLLLGLGGLFLRRRK